MATAAYPPSCTLCACPQWPGRPVRRLGSPAIPVHPGCFRAARRTLGRWRRTGQRHGLTHRIRAHPTRGEAA